MNKFNFVGDISIVLGGEAGQGIQAIESILTRSVKKAGYYVFATGEFMSRIRGGSNSTEIRVSSKPVTALVDKIDILVPLDSDALPHLDGRISSSTIIIGDRAAIQTDKAITDVPFAAIADEVGGKIYSNTIAAGVIGAILGLDLQLLNEQLRERFGNKDPLVLQKNLVAVQRGYAAGTALTADRTVTVELQKSPDASNLLFMSGTDAAGLGALAGGCNFIASYPMSPGTGLLTFMARNSHDFDIIVEQAEDEIAALNMALGAWYAGARGMVTTSGGGFALMCEAVSLSGMIETPAVIHIGQRPGPATGLPTRTEQADLELALYSGHGEFPRAIFSPGTVSDTFAVTRRAFNLADKFQIPVFLLTDQFLLDSSFMTPPFDIGSARNERHTVVTDTNYRRYAITPNGISPRGVPSIGEGLVRVDSDEHTEEGLITESAAVRTAQMDKRLRKLDQIKSDALPPRLEGDPAVSTVVICWGSTYSAVHEALDRIGSSEVALLHIVQPYPLHPFVGACLQRIKNRIMVEGNATGQMAKLIKLETGIEIENLILKYDGSPFSVEWLAERLEKLIQTGFAGRG